ncbi:MAG: hypothetical protein AAF939_10745 [Planctomycetota bacterium]
MADFRIVVFPSPNQNTIIAFLKSRFPEASPSLIERAAQAFGRFRTVEGREDRGHMELTYRHVENLLESLQVGTITEDEAIEITLVHAFIDEKHAFDAQKLKHSIS